MPDKKEKTAVVVAHTHWDREWYLPFQVFRHRFAVLVDGLIDLLETAPDFRCFVLDGQAIVIEDYLELRPEREAAFRKLVEEKRLLIGPWYVLPDEFLVSGESLVRNLERGHAVAERFGGVMKVGYVPDPFGHVGQLPQILRGFAIDNAIFTRGAGAHPALEKTVFKWKSPSGHEVTAIHQVVDGYGNFAHPPDDPAELVRTTRELLARTEKRSPFPFFLLCKGTDHLLPDPALPEKIRTLNENIEGVRFAQGDFGDFLRLAEAENAALDEYTGELRGGRYHSLLPGVFSARMYIKQENAATQTALAGRAEPLAAAAALLAGAPRPGAALGAAWRLLLQNHPHDSICGCSVDQVHREMMPRFQQTRQIAENLVVDAVASIAGKIHTNDGLSIIVFNTTGRPRTDVCACRLPLNGETAPLLDGRWEAESGSEAVPVSVEKAGAGNIFGKAAFHKSENLEIRFIAGGVPPFGWKTYHLVCRAPTPSRAGVGGIFPAGYGDPALQFTLENEYLLARVGENGSISLTHKETGIEYAGLNIFEDEGDCGDEYDFSPAGKTITTKRAKAEIRPLMQNSATAGLRIRIPLRLPEGLSADGGSRSPKKAPCPLTVDIFLHAGVPRLDARVELDNRASDHRLRAVFPTPFRADAATADSAFELAARPTRPPKGDDWHQKPGNTYSMQSFFDIPGEKGGLAILARSLPEYEAKRAPGGTTGCLTLLRCVGVLSRVSLPARPEQAGPDLPAPEAQCLGRHTFEYSIYPHGESPENAPHTQAAAFGNPLLGVPAGSFYGAPAVAVDGAATGGLIIKEVRKSAGAPLPEFCSLVKIEPAAMNATALRMRESGKLEMRFFNTSSEKVSAKIEAFVPIESVEKVNFLGAPAGGEQPQKTGPNSAALAVGPAEIVTLHFQFKGTGAS